MPFLLFSNTSAAPAYSYPQPPLTSKENPQQLSIPGADGIEIGSLGLQSIETVGRHSSRGNSEGSRFRRVHCVSNPCTFRINEIVVGVTSTDVLFHMSADELNAHLVPGSRLARIAQHLVQQQSYYPLFPPSCEANLNFAQAQHWRIPCQPDLLILPSKLTSFARTVCHDQSLVVNPGHLTRNTTGGTYAVLDVHPLEGESLEKVGGDDVRMAHAIAQRTRVEIRKI